MRSFLKLSTHFSSAHFYHQKKWSTEKNRETFGACFTDYGHGHNYKWEITLLRPNEAQLTSLGTNLDSWIAGAQSQINHISLALDHQHLNFALPEFKSQIPTTENISVYLKEKLSQSELADAVVSFRLFEMENLWTHVQVQNLAPM